MSARAARRLAARGGADLAVLLALALILGGMILALAQATAADVAFALDEPPRGVALRDFYGPERNDAGAYRWSKPTALIAIPITLPGTYRVALTLGDAPTAPAGRQVAITIDGEAALTVPLGVSETTYTFEHRVAPGFPPHPGWDELRIGLQAAPFTPRGDDRALGPLVARVAVTPLPPAWGTLLALLTPPLLLLAGAYGALRTARLGTVVATAILGGVVAAAGLLAALHRPAALALLAVPAAYPAASAGIALALGGALAVAGGRPLLDRLARATPALRALAFAVPALQCALLLRLIWTHTHSVPYIDEWETVKLIRHFRDGELLLRDFYYFHNEHRLIIPRAIHLVLIELTGWNRQIEMTFNLALVVATVALLLGSLRRGSGATLAAALLVPFSLILFSFAQYENLLFAFQTNFLLAVFGGACCVWGLTGGPGAEHPDRRRFTVAILGACIASLSTFGGLMTWAAFLPVVARQGRWRLAVWCAVAASVIGPYMIGFTEVTRAARTASTGALAHDPTLLVRFALTMLGGPLGYPDVTRAQLVAGAGLLVLAANLLAYRRYGPGFAPLAPWLGLALYGLGCTAVTTLGRAQSGLAQAIISRYQSFSSLWWFACLAIAGLTLARLRRLPQPPRAARAVTRINAVAALLAVACLFATNVAGWRDALRWPPPTLASQDCVVHYQTAPDACIDPFFPSAPWFVRIQADYLREQRLGVFRTAAAPLPPPPPIVPVTARTGPYDPAALAPLADTTALTIDGIGDLSATWETPPPLVLPAGVPLTLTGWAVDVLSFAPARGVFFTLDGVPVVEADYGQSRYDVGRLLGHKYADSGFRATIPGAALTAGEHSLAIRIVTVDGHSYYTPLHSQPLIVR